MLARGCDALLLLAAGGLGASALFVSLPELGVDTATYLLPTAALFAMAASPKWEPVYVFADGRYAPEPEEEEGGPEEGGGLPHSVVGAALLLLLGTLLKHASRLGV